MDDPGRKQEHNKSLCQQTAVSAPDNNGDVQSITASAGLGNDLPTVILRFGHKDRCIAWGNVHGIRKDPICVRIFDVILPRVGGGRDNIPLWKKNIWFTELSTLLPVLLR